jgi:hypothetical protein
MSKDLVKKEETALSTDFFDQYEGPTGFENLSINDVKKPFLSIQHKTELAPDKKTILRASGDFVNSVTKKSYGPSVVVQVLRWEKAFTEWKPNGGDFVGKYSEDEAVRLGKMHHHPDRPDGKEIGWCTKEGNTLHETYYFYCTLPEHKQDGLLIFGLKTTGLKHARSWLTIMNALATPSGKKALLFQGFWKLTTAENVNPAGQEYYTIGEGKKTNVEFVDWCTPEDFTGRVLPILEMLKSLDTSTIVESKDETEEETTQEWQ